MSKPEIDLNQRSILHGAESIAKYGSFDAKRYFAPLDKSLEEKLITVVVPMQAGTSEFFVFGCEQTYDLNDLQSVYSIISVVRGFDPLDLAADVRGLLWETRVKAGNAFQCMIDKELAATD